MRLSIILGCLAAINILLTFFYQVFILAAIGPSLTTDALFAAMVIPQLFLAVVSGSMIHILVPLLTVQDVDHLRRDAWSFVQGIFVLFGGLAIVLFAGAHLWVPWTVPGFDPETHRLTIHLVRIQLIGMVFTAVNGVLGAFYHARQRFVWAEFSPVIAAFIGLLFLISAITRLGVIAAAWALVIRSVVQTLLLAPGLGRYALPQWHGESVREAWRRLYPLLIGTTYYKTDQLLDRFLSSLAPAGQLSILHFAYQIYNAGNTIIGKAVATPIIPLLSQKASNGQWHSFYQLYGRRLYWAFWITVTVYAGILILGNPVLIFLFGHGKFEISDILYLKWLLICLGGLWIGGVLGQVLSTTFYAQGNTKTPTKIGAAGYTLGIGLKLIGFYYWGIYGLALGTTVYYVLNAAWLKVVLDGNKPRHIKVEGESI